MRPPRDAARTAGFFQGTQVEVEARRGEIIVRSAHPRFTRAELLDGTTPEAMRDAFDCGDDFGCETIG